MGGGSRTITVDGIEVPGVEAEGQYDGGGGSQGGGVTIKVRVGSHDCWVGFRAATRLGRYYYRYVCTYICAPAPTCAKEKAATAAACGVASF